MHLCKTYFIVREHLVSSSSWTQHYQLTKIMLKNRQNKKSHYWLLAEHEILTVLTLFKYRHVLTHPSYLLSSLHKLHFTSYFTLNIFVKSFLGKTKLTLCSSCLTSPHNLLKKWAKAKVNSNWKQSSPMGDEPSFLFTCTSNSAKNGATFSISQCYQQPWQNCSIWCPRNDNDGISVSTERTACQGSHACWLGHKWHKNSICNYLFSTKDCTLSIHTRQSALWLHVNMQYTALSFITIHM